jgi:hypothetical protein
MNRTRSALLFLVCIYAVSVFAGETIAGKVHNDTTGRPSAGDEVILLRLDGGMQEEARTHTDAQGAFSLTVTVPNASHLVRVLHQGVSYDETLRGNAPLEISVNDSVRTIPGLSGSLGIVRIESEGDRLKIMEMYVISNASSPPVTQWKPHNFEISLPPHAAIDSVTAKRAAGMLWVNLAPAPVKGRKDQFSLDFPIKPGDTLFKIAYHLPYDGAATLHLKVPYPIKEFAVAHPPSMQFKALRAESFKSPGIVQGLKLEQAAGKVLVGDVPAFEISGIGAAVPPADAKIPVSPSAAPPAPVAAAPESVAPAAAHGTPAVQSRKDSWIVVLVLGVLSAAGVFLLWRSRRKTVSPSVAVESLKEELFRLETRKLHGTVSAEEYESTRKALDLSLQRALARGKS